MISKNSLQQLSTESWARGVRATVLCFVVSLHDFKNIFATDEDGAVGAQRPRDGAMLRGEPARLWLLILRFVLFPDTLWHNVVYGDDDSGSVVLFLWRCAARFDRGEPTTAFRFTRIADKSCTCVTSTHQMPAYMFALQST